MYRERECPPLLSTACSLVSPILRPHASGPESCPTDLCLPSLLFCWEFGLEVALKVKIPPPHHTIPYPPNHTDRAWSERMIVLSLCSYSLFIQKKTSCDASTKAAFVSHSSDRNCGNTHITVSLYFSLC